MYENPYGILQQEEGRWIKTNFHTHAGICEKGNCGELPANQVIEAYRRAGYGALALSNHNIYIGKQPVTEGIEILDAVEYSKHPHMLQIGVGDYWDTTHQQAIENTVAAGGFVILCHPNWQHKEYWKWADIDALQGYTGIEILNPVIYTLKGSGLALDTWDYLLSQGKRVWGFGDDDFHQWRDIERAYNVIYTKSASYEDIKEAVQRGSFYVSSGVALKEISFDGQTLSVTACGFTESYITQFDYRFIGQSGRVLAESHGESATYRLDGSEPYLRVEVTGEQGAKMFLQPIMKLS